MRNQKGSENYNWRGGKSIYTCLFCGVRGSYLNAHHILPFGKYPLLRYEVNNGVTFCKGCHGIIHFLGNTFIPLPYRLLSEQSDMQHSLNSGKPLRKRGNPEPSPLWEGVETEQGAPYRGEETVQTTNALAVAKAIDGKDPRGFYLGDA